MEKIKVLFVCLGNICRSPLAEAIFKDKLKKKGLEDFFEVDSCGTSNYHVGDQPDSRTIANARKNGVTIDHCGRQFTANDLKHFDYILAMDHSNHHNILRLLKDKAHTSKVMLMREFDTTGKGEEVPDPYYGSEKNFQEVFEILNRSTENFLNHLQQTILQKP
ncbi:low molecular weight protein-tyrosine-phosphatase [Chryseolinea sp. H1M3-3]|uniref:low molecular weight protein-tyrosine-phosphatase n=1 Tax=Chryseolinea sp. H1M3-3 TaxID=3034144 RepID=UPI0023EB7A98|nr:low molecular weight protein-tyrosine-phosphatase [Chryseolinea sp. H1M3-3]